MTRTVLVTHADEPIGRRLTKLLVHDEDIGRIVALGRGRPPRSFDRFLGRSGGRLSYVRVDMAKHRAVADFFHAPAMRENPIDTVLYVPRHGPPTAPGQPMLAGVADRTAEVRLLLQHCMELPAIRRLVAVGSAFVYRLEPGNANRLTEESALDLDPDVLPEVRSWIDCDMIFHGEIHNQKLGVTLLRVPTVVASGGYVFMNPSLDSSGSVRVRALGFDPMCPLVSDKDVARAVHHCARAERTGIFNIAGPESVPLSTLARWTGASSLPIPGGLLHLASRALDLVGGPALRDSIDGPQLRYGFSLDTRRAERELGFRPEYRIGLARAGDGKMRIETAPA